MAVWLRDETTVISRHTGNQFALIRFTRVRDAVAQNRPLHSLPQRVIFFCFLVDEISTYKNHLLGYLIVEPALFLLTRQLIN